MARLEGPADASEGELVVDPGLRQRYRFERLSDAAGELLRIHVWVEPGGGVTPHVHPTMDERFTVHEGRAQFLSGRRWTEAGPGEVAHVPPGTRHAYRNRSDSPAYVVCDARPPESLEGFLTDAAALNRAGLLTRHAIPKTPGAALQAMLLAHHYRDMVELGFPPMPPRALQRLVVPPVARLAARRGYTVDPVRA